MKWRTLSSLVLVASLLTACASTPKQTEVTREQNLLYLSDAKNVGVLDLDQQQVKIMENDSIFIQSLNYDKERKRIVAPGYIPGAKFAGLLLFDGEKSKEFDLEDEGFAPVHFFQHGDYYVMDSARVLSEGPYMVTETIIYDIQQNTAVKKFMIPGQVKDIVGAGETVYVSSYYYPKSNELQGKYKSNIYEINLRTKEMRKVFQQDQISVPFKLVVRNGGLYGVYHSATNIPPEAPQDLFVKIDPEKGEVVQKVKLAPHAKDVVISADGKHAYVSHFYMWSNQEVSIEDPLSQVDLQSFEAKKIQGNYRAASLLEQKGKIYVGSDLRPEITVLDEQSVQVEKTLEVELRPLYMANENKSGTQLY